MCFFFFFQEKCAFFFFFFFKKNVLIRSTSQRHLMSTHKVCLSWRNKKNIIWIPSLIWSCEDAHTLQPLYNTIVGVHNINHVS